MKRILLTGASSGIGRATAVALAHMGHDVTIVARNQERALAVLNRMRSVRGLGDVIWADLSLMSEAKRVAQEMLEKSPRLDVVMHCAAIVPSQRVVTQEGLESAFATNVMAPFVLTRALLPALRERAPSRVVMFYGGNHGHIDLQNLQSDKEPFNGWNAYGQTKVCTALLTMEFAWRLEESGVTVNAAWPGIVNTEGIRNMPRASMRLLMFLMRPMMRSPQQGAQTPVYLATAPQLEKVSGKIFGTLFGEGRKEMDIPTGAKDSKVAGQLFEYCERLEEKA